MKKLLPFVLMLGIMSCTRVINTSDNELLCFVVYRDNSVPYADKLLDDCGKLCYGFSTVEVFFVAPQGEYKLHLPGYIYKEDSVDVVVFNAYNLADESIVPSEHLYDRQSFAWKDRHTIVKVE